ncbi:MAG: hypothetical protein AAF658_17090, partial [Myxococcota bacterium]
MKLNPAEGIKAAFRASSELGSLASSFVLRRKAPPAGSKPGTLALDSTVVPSRISAIVFDEGDVERIQVADISGLDELLTTSKRVWIDIQGFGDIESVHSLGHSLSLSSLELEDIVNTP